MAGGGGGGGFGGFGGAAVTVAVTCGCLVTTLPCRRHKKKTPCESVTENDNDASRKPPNDVCTGGMMHSE